MNAETFRKEIQRLMSEAKAKGHRYIDITSSEGILLLTIECQSVVKLCNL
jgi:hypothetical protein